VERLAFTYNDVPMELRRGLTAPIPAITETN